VEVCTHSVLQLQNAQAKHAPQFLQHSDFEVWVSQNPERVHQAMAAQQVAAEEISVHLETLAAERAMLQVGSLGRDPPKEDLKRIDGAMLDAFERWSLSVPVRMRNNGQFPRGLTPQVGWDRALEVDASIDADIADDLATHTLKELKEDRAPPDALPVSGAPGDLICFSRSHRMQSNTHKEDCFAPVVLWRQCETVCGRMADPRVGSPAISSEDRGGQLIYRSTPPPPDAVKCLVSWCRAEADARTQIADTVPPGGGGARQAEELPQDEDLGFHPLDRA
jgi:hypothetical protein